MCLSMGVLSLLLLLLRRLLLPSITFLIIYVPP
jgi:hypothetical protein